MEEALLIQNNIMKSFAECLKKSVIEYLEDVILFGSRARGDNRKNSDYDILIIHSQEINSFKIQDAVLDAEVKLMEDYEVLVSSIIYTQKEWEKKKQYPLGINILKEGISIWKKK